MKCENPREIKSLGFPVRCGKCDSCVSLRSYLKRSRIGLEVTGHAGEKAWFCTLTFRQVPSVEAEAYKEVQKWIKRVRVKLARSGIVKSGLRYVGVAEHGTRGTKRLHYHVLMFSPVPFPRKEIASWWRGYYKFVPADSAAWEYLVKYLQKQKAKVRGSQGLGRDVVGRIAGHEQVARFLDAFGGARIVRLGDHYVPRDLSDPFVRVRPERQLSSDEEWIKNANRRDLVGESSRHKLVGLSDETWKQWMKSTGQRSETQSHGRSTKERHDLTKSEFLDFFGNRGDPSPDFEEGPDGTETEHPDGGGEA